MVVPSGDISLARGEERDTSLAKHFGASLCADAGGGMLANEVIQAIERYDACQN